MDKIDSVEPTREQPRPEAGAMPVFVDLDGTLITSDSLVENMLGHIRSRHIKGAWEIVSWLRQGKAHLKSKIPCSLDVTQLPYRQSLIEYLRAAREQGRPIILATASTREIAEGVAGHLPLFDDLLTSTPEENLKGETKLLRIQEWCASHGADQFEYIGDSRADSPIWAEASVVGLAGGATKDESTWRGQSKECFLFPAQKSPGVFPPALKALRPYQWVKNTLVFLPLFLSGSWIALDLWLRAGLMFASLCLASSAVYLINDLFDIESDREHPRKKNRPIAKGTLLPMDAVLLSGMLACLAVLIPLIFQSPKMALASLVYMGVAALYTLWLKREVMIDVIVLAGLYTFRILAGIVATGVVLSHWMLAFSMFLFLSLAMAKRYQEMHMPKTMNKDRVKGRDYFVDDMAIVSQIGTSAAIASLVIFCLYIESQARVHYEYPFVLWPIPPMILYWLTRLWVIAHRGQLTDDPIVYTFKDKISLAVLGGIGLLIVVAKGFFF
ncbi:MAG: UbiA family prenyltransferase [Phycisphaerales bacterium]|nr:UbiA family prenyltransferase [Phycisphaerales bacterium]